MLSPAIWTAALPELRLPDALRALHACGWDHFELSTEHLRELALMDDPQTGIAHVLHVLDELHLAIPQAHAYLPANVAHPDEARRQLDIELILEDMRICAALGVTTVVIHPGVGAGYTTREERQRIIALNAEHFSRLSDAASELKLRIGIENLQDHPGSHGTRVFGATAEELLDLITTIGHPALGITLDTSHANTQGQHICKMIHAFGDRLYATHCSDNDGSGDQHRIPGHGTVDWSTAMHALSSIGYDGLINLEIPGERHPVLEIMTMKLRYARTVAGWLVDLAKQPMQAVL